MRDLFFIIVPWGLLAKIFPEGSSSIHHRGVKHDSDENTLKYLKSLDILFTHAEEKYCIGFILVFVLT